jgi:hypothetical protein
VIVAIAKAVEDGVPVRFVHEGAASGEESIDLPGAALRSSAIMLMGSGLKPVLLQAIRSVFEVVPLSEVEQVWDKDSGKPRLVFSIG